MRSEIGIIALWGWQLRTSRRPFSPAACYTDSGAHIPLMSAKPTLSVCSCNPCSGGPDSATSRAGSGNQPSSPTSSSAGSGGSLVSGEAARAELVKRLKLTDTLVGNRAGLRAYGRSVRRFPHLRGAEHRRSCPGSQHMLDETRQASIAILSK